MKCRWRFLTKIEVYSFLRKIFQLNSICLKHVCIKHLPLANEKSHAHPRIPWNFPDYCGQLVCNQSQQVPWKAYWLTSICLILVAAGNVQQQKCFTYVLISVMLLPLGSQSKADAWCLMDLWMGQIPHGPRTDTNSRKWGDWILIRRIWCFPCNLRVHPK